MCQHHDPLNKKTVDSLDIKLLYDKTCKVWSEMGEPLYLGCPIGHSGPIGSPGDGSEPWNERIAYLGGSIGNLKQTIFWLEMALKYEKEKAKKAG